jgi:hypothetical protein
MWGLSCTHSRHLSLVCFALFFGTDRLILESTKEPSLFLLSFLGGGGIGRGMVFVRYHAGAIMTIEGVATAPGIGCVL